LKQNPSSPEKKLFFALKAFNWLNEFHSYCQGNLFYLKSIDYRCYSHFPSAFTAMSRIVFVHIIGHHSFAKLITPQATDIKSYKGRSY
jgi:hypothetical protein